MAENIVKIVPNELDGDERYAIRIRSVNSFGVPSEWSDVLIVDTDSTGYANSGRISLTSNGLIAYDANGQTSLIYSGSGLSQRTNYCTNPTFGIDYAGWVALDNTSLARIATDFFFTDAATPSYKACLEISANLGALATATGIGILTAAADRISVSAGTVYTGSIYVKAIGVPVTLQAGLRFYDVNGTAIKDSFSFNSKEVKADNKWMRLTCIAIRVPPGAVKMGFILQSKSEMVEDQKFRVDGCLIELSNTLGDYFDGSTSIGATKWNGTPQHSSSTFDLSNSSYIDGGIFTSGTMQTAVDVGLGSPPKRGVIMDKEGLRGYSGGQPGPSFDLDTDGTFFVGRDDGAGNFQQYMKYDGSYISFIGRGLNSHFFVGDETHYISWDGANLTVTGGVTVPSIDVDDNADGITSFHVDTTGRMWLGAATFAAPAPFRVDADGDLDIGGTDATSFHVDKNGNMWSGSATNDSSAAFRVSNTGVLTATSVNISGAVTATSGSFTGAIYANSGTLGTMTVTGSLSGGTISSSTFSGGTFTGNINAGGVTITGGIIQSASSGLRTVISGSYIDFYPTSDTSAGIRWHSGSWLGYLYSDIGFYFATSGSESFMLQSGYFQLATGNGSINIASGNINLNPATNCIVYLSSAASYNTSTGVLHAPIHGGYGNTTGGTTGGSGAVLRADSGGNLIHFNWTTTFDIYVDSTKVKTFVIDHPTKSDSYLVHACSEGPTADVFYRGESQLVATDDGEEAEIILPDYFEDITELEGRTIQITPILVNGYPTANLAASRITNGRFKVRMISGMINSYQQFYWRVDAIRKNTQFEVEPKKSDVTVSGNGPYTYIAN